ncbi:MAG: DUF1624 domain-containing protein [Deltaproteobacteria bacterium]|nr:DUF1624 domain-containing protein [Nannocystaceae bacterium]
MERSATPRLVALDWMRGFVMVLMAIDHASVTFNAGRVADDSAGMYTAGAALPLLQFLTRFVTHLCAPTFVVLAGAAAALGVERRRALGGERAIDRDLLVRGLLLIVLDVVWMTTLSGLTVLMQVLFALGAGMLLMIPLRRLPTPAMLAFGVGWFVLGELVTGWFWHPPAAPEPAWTAAVLAVYLDERIAIVYPAIPWAAMMAIGWALGRWLRREHAERRSFPIAKLAALGVALLAVFGLVRGVNGYGNLFLLREDGSLAQWLHVSKYPPSLAYAALELGLLALGLALCGWLEPRIGVRRDGPLLVFGQTALFFYLLHFPLLGAAAMALGMFGGAGLPETYLAAAGVLAVLYPVCRWYRGVKQRRPTSWLRYI